MSSSEDTSTPKKEADSLYNDLLNIFEMKYNASPFSPSLSQRGYTEEGVATRATFAKILNEMKNHLDDYVKIDNTTENERDKKLNEGIAKTLKENVNVLQESSLLNTIKKNSQSLVNKNWHSAFYNHTEA